MFSNVVDERICTVEELIRRVIIDLVGKIAKN